MHYLYINPPINYLTMLTLVGLYGSELMPESAHVSRVIKRMEIGNLGPVAKFLIGYALDKNATVTEPIPNDGPKGICLDFSKDADTFYQLKDWCAANLQGVDTQTLQLGSLRLLNWGIKYHPSPHIDSACSKSGIMNESVGYTPEENRAVGRIL